MYLGQFLGVPEGVSEVMLGLISPAVGVAVASFSRPHVEVSSRAVADVVDKFIRAPLVVLVGVLAVLGLGEGELLLLGGFELDHLVDQVLGEQPSVMVPDVGVSARAV